MAATVTYLRQRHTNPWRCASSNHAASHQNETDRQSRTYICMSRKKNFPFFCWRCLRLKVVSTCRCWWCSPAWISPRVMMTHVWTAGTRHMRKSSDTRIRSKIDVRSFGNPFFFFAWRSITCSSQGFPQEFLLLFFLFFFGNCWWKPDNPTLFSECRSTSVVPDQRACMLDQGASTTWWNCFGCKSFVSSVVRSLGF